MAIESEGGKTVKFHKRKITGKLAIRTAPAPSLRHTPSGTGSRMPSMALP
jgi:DNA-binding CsgD family transcriptional regulator